MILVRNKNDIVNLKNGNQICGTFPELDNSEIRFMGQNNILFCEEGVRLQESLLEFHQDNSVIYLGNNKQAYKLNVSLWHESVFHMGRNNYINQNMQVLLGEQRHCFIGDSCMFSWGIMIMNSDAHLVYSVETGKRINFAKSVYIGDHVWLGHDCLLLKGTQVDSGSIIGAGSVVANKKIPHNESWGGNPARQLSDKIFWDGTSVFGWTLEETSMSENYSEFLRKYKKEGTMNRWMYNYTDKDVIEYSEIDELLNRAHSSQDRCDILIRLHEQKKKNRFVHNIENR